MQRLEVSGALRPIHGLLGVKRLINYIPISIVSRVAHGLQVSIFYHWCMTFQSRAIYRRIYLYFLRLSYGLDGQGSNPDGDENFRPSRPTLCPTQPL